MEPQTILILCLLIPAAAAAGILLFLWKRKQKNSAAEAAERAEAAPVPPEEPPEEESKGLALSFESLDALSETEEAALVEIKDPTLIAKIDNALQGALQTAANAGAVSEYRKALKEAGQLFQVIIPQGAALADSKALGGALRGFFRGAKSIQGQANLVAVDGNLGGSLAAMGVSGAAMGAAAMVVGQYYMSRINTELREISGELEQIASFQDREFQSRIYALVAEVQKASQFRTEIADREESRKRELDHLKSLEHECAQLLGQANLSLKGFAERKEPDYASYEKLVAEAQTWHQHQQVLLTILKKIEELSFALNLGEASRESCSAICEPYSKQAEEALQALEGWHRETVAALGIDLKAGRRRRQGVEGFLMRLPALLKEDLRYRQVPKKTADMISKQSAGLKDEPPAEGPDLFREDVRLIIRGGRLYYLPEAGERENK